MTSEPEAHGWPRIAGEDTITDVYFCSICYKARVRNNDE